MLLLKCRCGCLFTRKTLDDHWPTCPDCGIVFKNLSCEARLADVEHICKETGLDLRVIPDDARISVAFDL